MFSSFLIQGRLLLVDATRIADGKLVYVKEVQTNDAESRIALILNAYEDVDNHSVPILDTFVDATDETISYIVMPFLRLLNDPPFESIEEILDFADQILEVSTGSLALMDACINFIALRVLHSCTQRGLHTGDFLTPHMTSISNKSLEIALQRTF